MTGSVAERRRKRKANNDAWRKALAAAATSPEAATGVVLKALRAVAAQAAGENARHSALWRLHQQKKITPGQWHAGVTFQQDELASRDSSAADYLREGTGSSAGNVPTERLAHQVQALGEHRSAWAALCEAGTLVATDTRTVCVQDRHPRDIARGQLPPQLATSQACPDELHTALAAAERAVLTHLRQGLDVLARHYARRNR